MKRVKNLPLLSPGMLPLNKSEPGEQPIGTNGLSRSAACSDVRMTTELEFLLISDFNLSNLAALLSKDEESPMIRAATAPFGQVMQVLLESGSQFWSKGIQGVVVWTSPESVSPGYKRLLQSEEAEPEQLMHEVDEFCNAIKAIPGHVEACLVPTWVVGPFQMRMGLLDMDLRHGSSLALMRMNLRLVEGL